jgi:hypothetical protein
LVDAPIVQEKVDPDLIQKERVIGLLKRID